eukprot:6261083-Pyramimonas_sp.AAC.1
MRHIAALVLQRADGHSEDRRQQHILQHRAWRQAGWPTYSYLFNAVPARVPENQVCLEQRRFWHANGAREGYSSDLLT